MTYPQPDHTQDQQPSPYAPYTPYVPPQHLPVPAAPYGGYPMPAYQQPRLVSPGGRVGAALLDALIGICTLWIGWFIWAMVTFANGQTPARQLLGHVVTDENGVPFGWGRMAAREILIKGIIGYVAGVITLGVYHLIDFCTLFGDRNRTLHDRMIDSIVVYKS